MIKMDDELIGDWLSKLPDYFADTDLPLSPQHLLGHTIGRWRLRVMRIIMYRPFFLRWVQEGLHPLQSSVPEHIATSRCFVAARECVEVTSYFWSNATRTRLAAWYTLYFCLQAVLIPVHCLRRTSHHPQAPSWVAQVHTALKIMDDLAGINPNALKCKDVIYKLCGSHLVGYINEGLTSTDQIVKSAKPTSLSREVSQSWNTELDTAINHYDLSCNQLANGTSLDMLGASHDYAGLEAFNLSSFGISAGTYDLDPSMILMQ